jgi:hypothetical protein
MWSIAIPLIFDGGARFLDSLRKSADLTRGVRGELFLIFLVPGLLQAPTTVLDRIAGKFEFFESFLGGVILVGAGLWQILLTGFLACLLGVLCQHLLKRNDSRTSALPDAAIDQREAVLS